MQWVLDTVRVDGEPLTPNRWSRLAGKTRQHVATMLSRMRSHPDSSVTTETIKALANAAGVNAGWLLTGSGSPYDEDGDDSPQVLTDAVRFARANGISEEVIAEYRRTHRADGFEGATPEDLYLEMKAISRQKMRGAIDRDAAEELDAELQAEKSTRRRHTP